MRTPSRPFGAAVLVALLFPVAAGAQQTGAIAGVVRDTTGAVLPGVTVEASSPALIERVRVVTSDDAGQYRIIDLRPGLYTATFSLPGFATIKRDGIELSAGFTANVSVELRVGSVEETVTVSGASPLVDVQNVRQQRVMTREVIDSIPTSKQYTALASLIPGVVTSAPGGAINQDVGGMTGMTMTNAQIHGGLEGDGAVRVNGMSIASITSPGNSRTNIQDGNVEEYGMQLAAAAAEFPFGGIYFNVIPKQGGNRPQGALFVGGTAEALHTDNVDDDLRSRGLAFGNKVKRIADVNPSFGGPIARDRLWFHAAVRYFLTDSYVPGLYLNKDVRAWTYQPDTTERAVNDQNGKNASLNLTWQANAKNKFTMFYNYDFQCYCHYEIGSGSGSVVGIISSEAARLMKSRTNLYQGTWSSTVTNHLFLEAGVSRYFQVLPRDNEPDALEPSILEQSTGFNFRSHPVGYARNDGIIDHYRAALSYVTGTHTLKVGFELERQWANDTDRRVGSRTYRTLNGIPNQVTYYTLPYAWQSNMNPLGLYAQDQWKLHRWTINAGLRYDQLTTSYPAAHVNPTPFLPIARDYPGADVLKWRDLNPRVGMVWDLFGNGKTAIKATLHRYIEQEGKTYTNAANPVLTATNQVARSWNDANGDFIVQGDPLNPAANGELGASPNSNFGKPITTLTYDPDWTNGFGTRPYNWETSAGLQHEILPGVSANVAYFLRRYGNDIVTDNVLVSPGDYDPFCITAPLDSRLPGGGGQRICGLYNLNPAKVGLVQNVTTYGNKYGRIDDGWKGLDINLNARLPNRILFQGGVSLGKSVFDNCDVVVKLDNPSTYNCHQETPYLKQVKFLGSYALPWYGIQLSGTYQRMQYEPTGTFRPSQAHVLGMRALYVATNAVVAPSLGRSLSGGAANTTVDLLPANPGIYLDVVNQVDVRLAKTITVGRTRLQGLFDIYNLLNANPVLTYNSAYGINGASWLQPQAMLPGRLVRFGLQANF